MRNHVNRICYNIFLTVNLATSWDAWKRPSPDLPKELRQKKDLNTVDPNFEAHLPSMYLKGKNDQDRPNPDLPSELRLLKYRNMAKVQQLAAKVLRDNGENKELAIEVKYFSDQILLT